MELLFQEGAITWVKTNVRSQKNRSCKSCVFIQPVFVFSLVGTKTEGGKLIVLYISFDAISNYVSCISHPCFSTLPATSDVICNLVTSHTTVA